MKDRIKVVARFRPGDASNVYDIRADVCTVLMDGRPFAFDKVLDGSTLQDQVYDTTAKPIVIDLLKGYNGTIFVYGQTSSGKTYTMEGELCGSQQGLIPRVVDDIFNFINKMDDDIAFTIKISYYEIYMEKIRDLLDPTKKNLAIHEDKNKSTYVKNVTECYVETARQIMDLLRQGKRNRAVAETEMNEHSSRSHSVFQITVTQSNTRTQQKLASKLYLVDLAGSEKASRTNAQGMTLDEAKKINTSLMCLGKVISALSEGQGHVPYRDSKLTRVLQHSLGGNSRTTIVICMSMDSANENETKSTLQFGTRAKRIKNVVTPNIELSLEELQKRYDKIKRLYGKCNSELTRWRRGEKVEEGDQFELIDSNLSSDMASSLTSSSPCACKVGTIPVIRAGGSAQYRTPCLVNLNEDPLEGEFMSVDIPEGMLLVGSSNDADLQLSGVLIQPVHCKLENRSGRVYLKVYDAEASVFINGELVSGEVALEHGDRVIIGGSHYFRLTACNGATTTPLTDHNLRRVVDYEFAKTELINSINHQKHSRLVDENTSLKLELEHARTKLGNLTRELEASKALSSLEDQTSDSTSLPRENECALRRVLATTEEIKQVLGKRVPKHDKDMQIRKYLDSYSCSREDSLWSNETFTTHVQLREANELCKVMKRDIVFSREVVTMDNRCDVFIRAQDMTNNRAIMWSAHTFADRLGALKTYYSESKQESIDSGVDDLSSMFGCDDVWDKDLSLISDVGSVTSERQSSESFLSSNSFVSTPRSCKSGAPNCQDSLSHLQLLLSAPARTLTSPTGSPHHDRVVESVRCVAGEMETLASSSNYGARLVIPKLTLHLSRLHCHSGVLQSSDKPNYKLNHAVRDLVAVGMRMVQSVSEGVGVCAADISRSRGLLQDVLYQTGHMCAAHFVQSKTNDLTCKRTVSSPDRLISDNGSPDRQVLTSPFRLNNIEHLDGKKQRDMDVTSDYNSSGSSINTTSTEEPSESSRVAVLSGVQHYLLQLLHNTRDSVSSTVTMATSAATMATSAATTRDETLARNSQQLCVYLEEKAQDVERVLNIQESSTTAHSLLRELTTPYNVFRELDQVNSWSRILGASLADKENHPDQTTHLHATQQLNTRLELLLLHCSSHKVMSSSPRH